MARKMPDKDLNNLAALAKTVEEVALRAQRLNAELERIQRRVPGAEEIQEFRDNLLEEVQYVSVLGWPAEEDRQARIHVEDKVLLLDGRKLKTKARLDVTVRSIAEADGPSPGLEATMVRPTKDFIDAVTDRLGKASFDLRSGRSVLLLHLNRTWELELNAEL